MEVLKNAGFLQVRYLLKIQVLTKKTEMGRINVNMKAPKLAVMEDIQSL